MKLSWIVLTMGDRPIELADCIDSIRDQDIAGEIIVVYNGADPFEPPPGVVLATRNENLGVPGGRNLGAAAASGEILFFIDDDARIASEELAAETLEMFKDEPRLAVVSFRIQDETGQTSQRHIPRIGNRDAATSFEATTFLGGACAIRKSAFDEVGTYEPEFFYAFEESDLAWRLLDAGYVIRYRGDLGVSHPRTVPKRHASGVFMHSRNRVFLARRRLPAAIAIPHVLMWTTLSLVRSRSLGEARSVLTGVLAGLRMPLTERRPISWSTVARMTRLGRPPLI